MPRRDALMDFCKLGAAPAMTAENTKSREAVGLGQIVISKCFPDGAFAPYNLYNHLIPALLLLPTQEPT